jgi:hypothetical protein
MSLVELEVALVVLAIGLLATLALVARAGALLRVADAEEGAARVAGEVLDSLLQHGAPSAGALGNGRYSAGWSVVRDSRGVGLVTLVIRYDDGQRLRADTFAARAAPWPRTVRHGP